MLRAEDFRGDTWKRLKQTLTARLSDLRVQNDGDYDQQKTALIRGQISEVKRLLDLSPENSSTDTDPFN